MNKVIIFILVCFFTGCTANTEINKLQDKTVNYKTGSIVLPMKSSRSLNDKNNQILVSNINKAQITVSGFDMDDITVIADGVINGRGEDITIENIPVGKNRVVTIKPYHNDNAIDNIHLRIVTDILEGENSAFITWQTTPLGDVIYILNTMGLDTTLISDEDFDHINNLITGSTASHPSLVNAHNIALDYYNGSLKDAGDSHYIIQTGKLQLDFPGITSFENITVQCTDPSSQILSVSQRNCLIENIKPGNWELIVKKNDIVIYNNTVNILSAVTTGIGSLITSEIENTYTPYIGPYLTLITPVLDAVTNTPTVLDPSYNMIVNYESKLDSTFTAKAFYRVVSTGTWLEKTEDDYEDLPAEMGKVHHITIDNLTPDTTYEYMVLGADYSLSPVYTFKTASLDTTKTRFLVVGDQQDEEAKQRWADIAGSIVNHHIDDFDFIISVGDMAKDDTEFNGDRYYWWKVFFDKGKELLARKPMFPTMGNHETPANPGATGYTQDYWSNAEDTLTFRKYFYINPDMTTPDFYSFTYGSGNFISINTEIPVFYGRFPEKDINNKRNQQSAWLSARTTELSLSKPWSFVFGHVPVFDPSAGKTLEVQLVRPYVEYFNTKVDWYLSGHVHTYQRVRPLTAQASGHTFQKEYGRAAGQGVGYLIVPPAGQWPRFTDISNLDTETSSFPQYKGNTDGRKTYQIGFTIINVDGENFDLKTYGLGDVDNRNGAGYGDNGQKRLIDAVNYTRKSTASSSSFPMCYYRGTYNGWKSTAMTLVDTNLWDITILAAPGEFPGAGFKFFNENENKWYGDNEPRDGKAQSNEESSIPFLDTTGTYNIRFNDSTRDYTITKLE